MSEAPPAGTEEVKKSFKEQGTEQFKLNNFDKAVEFYTYAIEDAPGDHTIFGNRAASYQNLKKYTEALADGEKCVSLKSDWIKGYQRKANAYHGLGMLNEACNEFDAALKIDPNNAQIKKEQALTQKVIIDQAAAAMAAEKQKSAERPPWMPEDEGPKTWTQRGIDLCWHAVKFAAIFVVV